MKIITNSDVNEVFKCYPDSMRKQLYFLRKLIIETASEISQIKSIQETLKWGEPAYLVKGGSTIRIAWKESSPNQYAMYFNCKTKLVDTFKERYKSIFVYQSNRAIIFNNGETVPVDELKLCIKLSLTYHQIKNYPMLGI